MDIDSIEKEFTKIAHQFRYIDRDLLKLAKNYFEKTLSPSGDYKLEMTVIVDANIIIQEALAYIKKNSSSLLSISKSPFFKIIAPKWLLEELNEKLPTIAKEKNIDEQQLKAAANEIMRWVKILDINNNEAYNSAKQILGERDPEGKDAPYVALYLSVKSHGILTADNDIIDQKEIKTWKKVGFIGKIVSTFERGSLSLIIVGKGIPVVLTALYEVIITLVNGIWETLKSIGEAFVAAAVMGVNALAKLPGRALLAIGVAIGAAGAIIAYSKEAKEWINRNIIQPIKEIIISVLKNIYEVVKQIISILMPILGLGAEIILYLFKNIDEAMQYYESINLSGSDGNS